MCPKRSQNNKIVKRIWNDSPKLVIKTDETTLMLNQLLTTHSNNIMNQSIKPLRYSRYMSFLKCCWMMS